MIYRPPRLYIASFVESRLGMRPRCIANLIRAEKEKGQMNTVPYYGKLLLDYGKSDPERRKGRVTPVLVMTSDNIAQMTRSTNAFKGWLGPDAVDKILSASQKFGPDKMQRHMDLLMETTPDISDLQWLSDFAHHGGRRKGR